MLRDLWRPMIAVACFLLLCVKVADVLYERQRDGAVADAVSAGTRPYAAKILTLGCRLSSGLQDYPAESRDTARLKAMAEPLVETFDQLSAPQLALTM